MHLSSTRQVQIAQAQKLKVVVRQWSDDIQYNDTETNDIQNNAVHHNKYLICKFKQCILKCLALFKLSLILKNCLQGTQTLQQILIGNYLQK